MIIHRKVESFLSPFSPLIFFPTDLILLLRILCEFVVHGGSQRDEAGDRGSSNKHHCQRVHLEVQGDHLYMDVRIWYL